MITILCPTRSRPKQFERMINSAFATAETEIKIYCYVSTEDPKRHEYDSLIDDAKVIGITGPDYSCVMALNEMGRMREPSQSELVMVGADDTIFATKGWDKAILDHYHALEKKPHVYAMQDSRSEDGTPHLIMSREYIDTLGYVFPPIFLHWFADSWTTEIAKSAGCFTHMKDYLLIHDKPSDRSEPDETHTRIRKLGWQNRDTYVNEKCQHYLDLEKSLLRMAMI